MVTVKITAEAAKLVAAENRRTKVPKAWIVSRAIELALKRVNEQRKGKGKAS